jgi:tRNA(Ile)-lysidine synthase TilS/MesJ
VLPAGFPGVAIDGSGLCSLCAEAPPVEEIRRDRELLRARLEERIETLRGRAPVDCIVAYSGGKDSSIALRILVEEYGLRVLAITVDNGFVSGGARENAFRVTKALGVDYEWFVPSPEFMTRLYRVSATEEGVHAPAALRRASSICNSCITLINTHMVRRAAEIGAPMVAGGYIGGQVPKDAAILDFDLLQGAATRRPAAARYTKFFGAGAERYLGLPESLGAHAAFPRITILNPLLTRSITEEEIIASIAELGWHPVADTGRNSSNCRLNDLAIALHHRRHGTHPYIFETAEQVRAGLLPRDAALERILDIPTAESVAPQARAIGLDAGVLA